jgi:hypothetical protein
MKSILITLLLLLVAIGVYNSTIGGDDGTKAKVRQGGGRINSVIQQIDP